ncbi:MAG: helix-turn-helix domain-containing protein [Armatimonadota bacterium]
MQAHLFGADAVLNLSEAAILLRVSEKTIGSMARQGKLPCQRVGREWRFLKPALEGWLAGRTEVDENADVPASLPVDASTSTIAALSEPAISGCRDSAFTQNRGQPLHRWVPWIAGFSASFVDGIFDSALRDAPRDVTVLDPFAGVGTTLVQALKRGYNVLGFEINPYAHLACNAKLNLRHYDVGELREKIDAFRQFMGHVVADALIEPLNQPPPKFISRHPFFSQSIERQVLFALDFIASERTDWIADLLRVAIGAQMVSFSNYTYEPSLGTRKAAGKSDIQDADVGGIIATKLEQMADDIAEGQRDTLGFDHNQSVTVLNRSCLDEMPTGAAGSASIVITSPPYLNNYHYLRNTRPQLHWLGLMPENQRRALEEESFGKYWQTVRCEAPIGLAFGYPRLAAQLDDLRQTNSEKGPYGGPGWSNYAACYFNDTYRFCQRMGSFLRPDGLMVVVIGNNILQGIEFQTDRYFAAIAEQVGFETVNIHVVREKRTGSSIINSTTRVGKTSAILYETALELRWRGTA